MNKKVIGTFTGKCCDAEVYNNNGMLLNRELFEILINSDEYKRAIEYRHYIGFLGHPEDPNCMDFKDACIIMTSMEMREDGSIWGTFDLVDTPVGRIVKTFIDAGVIFGISIRGAGDIDNIGKVDPESFVFRGYDLVTFPAYDDAIPEFREIAASSDMQKQSKYRKVCAAIKTNLQSIHSCEALEIIRSQFDDSSKEYQLVDDRIHELDDATSESRSDDTTSLMQQKLDAMTSLYLQQVEENRKLHDENNELRLDCSRITAASDRRIRTIERIMGAQLRDMEQAVTAAENKYKTAIRAGSKLKEENQQYITSSKDLKSKLQAARNEIRSLRRENQNLESISATQKITASKQLDTTQGRLKQTSEELRRKSARLSEVEAALDIAQKEVVQAQSELDQVKSELEDVRSSNLILNRKIESATQTISANEETIEGLEAELRETVTANQKLGQDSSNRDAQIANLHKEIKAAHQLIGDYQQAYADMCASAVGVSVEDIPVTCKTSPGQLKNFIFGSTSTANILANPAYVEPEHVELEDDGMYEERDLVSI